MLEETETEESRGFFAAFLSLVTFQLGAGIPGCEIFFSTMVLQIYYVTSVVPTLRLILRSRFSLDPLYSQANWCNGTGQLG